MRWSYRVAGTDAWRAACGETPPSWCADWRDITQWDVLGSGANVFRTSIDGRRRDVVGIGSRTGIYRLFDAGSGALLWATLVGPQFGIQWGTATDGERIYVSIANPTRREYLLQPSGTPSTGGSWAALDAATGRILWQTAVPEGVDGLGPPTVANGVVYAGSMARSGNQMFAQRHDGRDPLAVRRRRIRQRRSRRLPRIGLLGLGLRTQRQWERQALRVQYRRRLVLRSVDTLRLWRMAGCAEEPAIR